MSSSYAHLLSEAKPDLPSANCIFLDDIKGEISLGDAIDLIESLFSAAGEVPEIADFQLQGRSKARRINYAALLKEDLRVGFDHLSIFAKAVDDLTQVWHPPAFATFRVNERVNFAGFYSSNGPGTQDKPDTITSMAETVEASSAYQFDYPLAFSPVAYLSGLSYSPNRRSVGSLTYRDEERVSHYRDHCWRGHRSSDGYLRDLYNIMVFGEATADRRLGNQTLVDWIESSSEHGSISTHGSWFSWQLGHADRQVLQRELDAAHILLAGFSPDKGV